MGKKQQLCNFRMCLTVLLAAEGKEVILVKENDLFYKMECGG